MNIVASAPGKLVLLGEYAVLEGAPAISMAVNRRAKARIAPRAGAVSEAYAPDVLDARVPFTLGANGLPDWSAAAGDAAKLGLVDEVLRGLADEQLGPDAAQAFGLSLDTSDFFDSAAADRPKLGLGSSAALTVALASGLAACAGHAAETADRDAWLTRLLRLHRKFQGGHGSGVDVATSLVGGVIAYQLFDGGQRPQARALVWPDTLHKRFVWSGCSASTPKFLSILRAWRATHEAEYTRRMNGLHETASAAVEALASADAAAFLDCASRYAGDLRALGDASGVSIYSAEHLAIAELAQAQAGVVYKPCGAGGGDVGVLFATDPERLAALDAPLAAAGFSCVALTVDPSGLQLEFMESNEA